MAVPPSGSKATHSLPAGRFPGLDAIRALSIGIVIIGHIFIALRAEEDILWVPVGYNVMMFFVLSGFLITHLLLREHGRSGGISLRNFYSRRALKILPPLYIYWIVVVGALLLTGRQVPWEYAWSTFFYYTNYLHALVVDQNSLFSHTWTLAIEEQFYLLWPLALLAVIRRPAQLPRLLCIAIVSIWVGRWLLLLIVRPAYLYFAFETRVDAILVGCLLAILLQQGKLDRLTARLTSRPYLPLVTLAAILLIVLAPRAGTFVWTYAVTFPFFPILAAVLLLQLIHLGHTSWKWLEAPWLRYVGKISYSLFLWQQLTVAVGVRATRGYPGWLRFVATVLLTAGVSVAAYYLVEEPMLRRRRRLREKARVASPVAA